jgi:tetratricopeptide (TPR) repeat protein
MKTSFAAYKGDEPYIFVSYAHADDKLIESELERLHEHDYLVWYDEGIHGGSRWTDDIANRIRDASLVIYYVTPNSAASENCANEIDYALDNQRPVLAVHLKPTDLPEGQKLALGGRQMVMRHQMSGPEYDHKLLEAIALQFGRKMPKPGDFKRPIYARPATLMTLAGLVVVTAGLWFGVFREQEPQIVEQPEQMQILIADFDNQTDVKLFDGTLETALEIGLEVAPFIASFDRNQARKSVAALGGNEGLGEQGARLIAVRDNLKLVLAGKIAPDGAGFEVNVRAIEPVSGSVKVEAAANAKDQLSVLEVIASLSREIRTGLGDVPAETSTIFETLSATSLEAAAAYSHAQQLAAAWKHEEASIEYENAVSIDENFGRAYSGWAYSAHILGQSERAAELWGKALQLLDTMTERERLRTLGIYYGNNFNYEKATEHFTHLTNQFPADAPAKNNLAMMHFLNLKFDKAAEVEETLLDIYPDKLLYVSNYMLFRMYAGEFEAAREQAEQLLVSNPGFHKSYLAIAAHEMVNGQYEDAERAYEQMAEISDRGSRLAITGQADLATARGDYKSASRMLLQRIAANETVTNSVIRDHLNLAMVQYRSGEIEAAMATLTTIDDSLSRAEDLYTAGEIYLLLEQPEMTRIKIDKLRAQLHSTPRAYSEMLLAQIELGAGNYSDAIDHINTASSLSDLWLTRFTRGRIYLEAGLFAEAIDDFQECLDRQGEAVAMFLDDVPTFSRLVEVRYWLGRAKQSIGMNTPASRHYRDYINARDLAAADTNILDAQTRLDGLSLK